MVEKPDFGGWATKNNLKCSDGRVIMHNAFKDCDGMKVPLVWNHDHSDPSNVLGHAILQNRDEGVYAYGYFNDTESGAVGKALVQHGDIVSLSIYANKLKQNGPNVLHGMIREVSLVHAGANPGAFIDNVIMHGESIEDEAYIYTGEDIAIEHAKKEDDAEEIKVTEEITTEKENKPVAEEKKEKTIKEIFDTLTDEQKDAVYAIIGAVVQGDESGDEEEEDVKHNVFESDYQTDDYISHSEMQAVVADAKRFGSMKESAIAHGIEDVGLLFPEDKAVSNTPEWIKRDTGWVGTVMNGVHHTPFSRIKSLFANITEDDARAKGYLKGNMKKEEFFSLLKRTTSPTTIYKKQKMDRDDVVDITDFDVVAWLKSEMRIMLDEEIARAVLIGDGRLASSEDKIDENCVKPIAFDADLFTIKTNVEYAAAATAEDKAKLFIKGVIRARKNYKGSGNPTAFMTEDMVTECLLIEDSTGRTIYNDVNDLAKKLRVKEIVTVPVLDNVTGPSSGKIAAVIVNLADYTIGADKGGAVNLFDDFDIDYNAQKYLIETRCSGALTKPYSAIVVELSQAAG